MLGPAGPPHPFGSALGDARQRLLARLERSLGCPGCGQPFERSGELQGSELVCQRCGTCGRLEDDQFVFGGFTREEVAADWLNRFKTAARQRIGPWYGLLTRIVSPVYFGPDIVRPFLQTFDLDLELVADLGCGTTEHDDLVVAVDGVAYPNVHVITDLEKLPFQNDSLSGVLSIAVLHHVADPRANVVEMRRVLRPGGRALCYIPFIQGYHASPHDYQRFTQSGVAKLFGDFELVRIGLGAGPTSGMLWVLQEWLAMVLSCGSVRLYRLLLPLTWVLFPLKFLDAILIRHPAAHVIASGFLIEVRKPAHASTAPAIASV